MCIIIDTNTFANVFNANSVKHEQFKPVLDWIIKGNGKIVYGGSKYMGELKKAVSYLKIFRLLNQYGKAIKLNDEEVDAEQVKVEELINHPDFDDPHLPAIVIISSCKLICTGDTRSAKFVTNSILYKKKCHVPKYYTSKRNYRLLCDYNIPDKYKSKKLTKNLAMALTKAIG
ncbi:MAG: hypothetical protein LIP06_06550 [Tannerellaceae bacterium]|nr:hypothetical protein [Tannerellaceae bacterium]